MGRFDESEPLLRRAVDASPLHAVAGRALGAYYASRRRDADAEKYLKAAAATGDRDAQTAIAALYASLNRGTEALVILEDLIAAGDQAGDLSVRAADAEVSLGRTTAALQRLDMLLKRLPRHARALELRAQVLFGLGQVDLARASADAAVAAEPGSSSARRLYGRILTASGDLDRAFDQFAEALWLDPAIDDVPREIASVALALRRNEMAVHYARQALHRDAGDRAAAVTLVAGLTGIGRFAEADKALRPLLARESDAPDLLLQLGRIQAGRGDHAAARATYTRVLQAKPDSVEALSGLVSIDLAEGQAAAAQTRVNSARIRNPTEPKLFMLAARAAKAVGDFRDGESTLRALINIEPANVEAGVLLAEILAAQNRPDLAKTALDDLLTRRPASVEAQLALARLFESTGQRPAAQTTLERLLAAQPRTPLAAYRLAMLYVASNERLDQALELARSAKQALPDDPAVSDLLGWIYVRKNLPALGLPHLKAAVEAAPTQASYRYHLGVAYVRTNRLQEARAELTRALQLDPAFAGADDARAALAKMSR
jgi:tetratricopeptide (TPR) repeat protein